MSSSSETSLQLLQEHGIIDSNTLNTARAQVEQRDDIDNVDDAVLNLLVEKGYTTHAQATQLLAQEFDMETVDLADVRPSNEALEALALELANRYKVFPLELDGSNLLIAVHDPLDMDSVDSISHILNLTVETRLAPKEAIVAAIHQFYEGAHAEGGGMSSIAKEAGFTEIDIGIPTSDDDEEEDESQAPILKYVNMLITEAIKRRASDIHLEPLEKRFRVRYRIDGVLAEVENPPKRLQPAIISRLKLMANVSIAEKRVPQDGRIQVKVGKKELDLRVSSLPTAYGESIVMRILDKEGLRLGLPELGFFSDDQAVMERLITMPDGILLVTGPTGSGKSTTLYSCLNVINHPDRKIITVEDPVEYQMAGINQVQVRREVGMDFASALRAMLRQAPNIIMIGEIRDLETAEIAINASLTGHMVFSTLHTNDAPSAVSRLVDIGVKPFLVSAALRAALAQRLVRVICDRCKKSYEPTTAELHSIGLTESQASNASFAVGEGCPRCNGRGYYGRNGIFELFIINEEIQQMIYENVSVVDLRRKARELGMRTMREDGIRKIMAGVTSIEEVLNATVAEG